jgi:WD40 repeat protein
LLVDGRTGSELARFDTGDSMVYVTALFGDRAAAGTADGAMWLLNLPTGELLARLFTHGVMPGWRDGGRVLRTIGGTIVDWRVPSNLRPHVVRVANGVTGVSVSPTGELLAVSAGDGTGTVFGVGDGAVVAELKWQSDVAKDVAFSPDGRQLAIAVVNGQGKRIYDTRTWQLITELGGRGARRLAWQPNGALVTLDYDRGVRRWTHSADRWSEEVLGAGEVFVEMDSDTNGHPRLLDQSGRVWRFEQSGPVRLGETIQYAKGVASLDDRTVVAGRYLKILDAGGKTLTEWRLPEMAIDVAVSPDRRWIAVGHLDGSATLWSVEDSSMKARFAGHTAQIASVEFSPDGQWVWTGSWDHTARAWSLQVVDTPAEPLLGELETAWGMTFETALARVSAR